MFDCPPFGRAVGALALVVIAAVLVRAQAPAAPPSGASFDVRHYAVALTLDVAAGAISGTERIEITLADGTASLVFDSGDLIVDSVQSPGALPFVQRERKLIVTLPSAARAGEERSLAIRYHGTPRNGLTIDGAKAQAYTTFSTSHWMVAVDAPSDRATLELDVAMPAEWKAAGSGRFIDRISEAGVTRYSWQQDQEMPSYTFGFAAGAFTESTQMHGALPLTYLGSGFSAQELNTIFRDTPRMAAFFEERAGLPFPGNAYAQALVAVSGGQEMAEMAHMSEAYGRSVLADATATSLIAHELAHQWWGNLVTNRDWTHFWLNEGFATFMAAAYKERASGSGAYAAEVERWRTRVQKLRADGRDRRLVFPEWNRPTADDRAVVYQKGALALHELRTLMGDAAFWTAVRAYTKTHAGKSVTSTDLQRAFESSSGRDLRAFFGEWVQQP